MKKWYHLIPAPAPLTSIQKRQDVVKQEAQAPYLSVMIPMYVGIAFCALATSLFLMK